MYVEEVDESVSCFQLICSAKLKFASNIGRVKITNIMLIVRFICLTFIEMEIIANRIQASE